MFSVLPAVISKLLSNRIILCRGSWNRAEQWGFHGPWQNWTPPCAIWLTGEIAVPATTLTVRRTLHEVDLYGWHLWRNPLLTKQHKTARPNFAKDHKKKPEKYWQNILYWDKTKMNVFGSDDVQHVWRWRGLDDHSDGTVATVKHGGGSVLGVGEKAFIDGTMNSSLYTQNNINEWKIWLPVSRSLTGEEYFLHGYDPTHSKNQLFK